MIEAREFVHRITRDEYYRMAEAGILDPGRRYEPLAGQIIDVSPRNSPHGGKYRDTFSTAEGAVAPTAFPDVTIAVEDIF